MDTYRRFLKRFGFTGFMLSVLAVSFLAMLVLWAILGDQKFATMWSFITLPVDLETAVRQPWSLLTFWLGNDPRGWWLFLTDLAVLYGFGQILNAMIGDRRMQAIVLMSILSVGLLAVGLGNLLPWIRPSEGFDPHLFGFGAINATIVAATITLVPRYNFRLLFWDIPLVFVGLLVLAIFTMSHGLIFTIGGLADLVGAGLGFGIIKILRSGWDLTNWFRGAANRPAQPVARQPEPVISTNRPIIRTVPKQQPQSQQQPFMSDAEELDYLLDKIGEVGYSGLSQAEKERLDKLAAK